MKKIILVTISILLLLHAFCQTTLTALIATGVNYQLVRPVRVQGTSDYFFFEGVNGRPTGCFKLNTGTIDFSGCDHFTFEFAEYYQGNSNIPLYYIRRTDGLYLGFQLGGAAFVNKITGIQSRFQKWLIAKDESPSSFPGNNSYNFLLPLAPLQYGYTLRELSGTQLGFYNGPKISTADFEFLLGQVSKKSVAHPEKTRIK